MDSKLTAIIREAGIIGAGGAGFPTHVKAGGKADFVIANGAECEPLLRVDQQLLEYRTDEVLAGLKSVIAGVGARKGIIGIKKKHAQVIEQLEKRVKGDAAIDILALGDFYPAGDEQVMVYEALERIVPEGGIPLQVGVMVSNIETLLNVHNAMMGIPVTHKYLTVTGAVQSPVTVRVPIGISFREAVELAGGVTVSDYKLIEGGPMMGKLTDIPRPVTKTTKGIIVLPAGHPLLLSKEKSLEHMLKEARTACCHCSLCTEVCPRNLLGHKLHPDRLMRLAAYNSTCEANVSASDAFLCCECGLCEYACIMGLQPWKLNNYLKRELGRAGVKNPNNRTAPHPNEFRRYKKFPVKKLIARLGLEAYDEKAPLLEEMPKDFTRVVLPLKQHVGQRAEPLVKIGDLVAENQLIADVAEGQLGARLHASIGGWVRRVDYGEIEISK
ncbi:MAG TPA: 4Fe-4S dicluster domain-containing protein [Clostridia bacterium]|nr:4Fe-4S dicluster domain-containing protein [Clostridia bacterium]